MKTYPIRDVTNDKYLNPAPPATRPVANIQKIVIHHDAVTRPHNYDTMARLRTEAAVHYKNLGPGLQYHYSIDNTGEIFLVRPHTAILWHAGNLAVNRASIAIKLDGYFHPGVNQKPTREQLEALQQLLVKLCTQHPEFPADQNDVFGHREISSTACPGNELFPYVMQFRNTGKIVPQADIVYDWPSLQPSAPTPPPTTTPEPVPTPPSVEVNYRVYKDGKQIGAYKLDTNAWNKYVAESADNIMTSSGQDVTEQLRMKFAPPAPPPEVPTPPAQDENTNQQDIAKILGENNTLLKRILEIVEAILSKITGVFK